MLGLASSSCDAVRFTDIACSNYLHRKENDPITVRFEPWNVTYTLLLMQEQRTLEWIADVNFDCVHGVENWPHYPTLTLSHGLASRAK